MLLRFLLLAGLLPCALGGPRGRYCGRFQRQCGPNAMCDYAEKKCKCLYGYYGCPIVECHQPHEFQCTVKADPHLLTFGDATAKMNWPCKYRLTRVQHALGDKLPGLDWCSTEVFGFNEVRNGRYFTSGAEVVFSVGDSGQDPNLIKDSIRFDVFSEGFLGSDGSGIEWGTDTYVNYKGINVSYTFDEEHHFAIFDVPLCGIRVKFRPFNPVQPTGPQSMVPAISIVVRKNTVFGSTELGSHPFSLCGMSHYQGSDEYQFFDRKIFLRLTTISQTALYDILHQNLKQEALLPEYTDSVLQNSGLCQTAVDQFTHKCVTKGKKRDAIVQCTKIFPKLAGCLGINVLDAFNGCVEAVCVNKATGCHKYTEVLRSNPDCRNGPRGVKQFCRGITP